MNLRLYPKKFRFPFTQRLTGRWDLLHCLVDRNIKVIYKRSILGTFWMLIKPLLHLSVYAFVFRLIIPVSIPHFTSFLFAGLLFWNWFSNSLAQATGVIISNRALIRQPGFPISILPIVSVMTEGIHLLFAFPILVLFLVYEGIGLQPIVGILPLVIILQFLFTLSLGYILAAVNVIWRDTQHTITVLLQMLMYLSGIFYDVRTLPSNYQSLLGLNPMVNFLNTYRSILIEGIQPNWLFIGIITGVIVIILPLGLRLFYNQSARFVEEL